MTGEQDLLHRLLQQLSELLDQVQTLKRGQLFAPAGDLIASAYRRLFGLDHRLLHTMHPDQVAALLVNKDKAWAFGQLLSEEADLLLLEGDSQSAAATATWTLALLSSARVPEDQELLGRLRLLAQSQK